MAFSDKPFKGFKTPKGDIVVPTVTGEAKAPELKADVDFSGCILPAGGTLAVHAGAPEKFFNDMTEIMKKVWNDENYYGWIEKVMLNRFEVYGDDAAAFIDEACRKSLEAFGTLSGKK